ncbi:MAG: hypothetical protein NC816_00035 [Candidatus Omnitrophica bacterium]|nr:hypothetical protein [Candidatus Omnitrophota bacterium]
MIKKIVFYILFFVFFLSSQNRYRYSIYLENPLYSNRSNNLTGPLNIDIYSEGSKFERFFIGDCLNYNTAFCIGKVEDFEIKRDTYRLNLKVFYLPDSWVSGGKGVYKLEFKVNNEKIEGKYEGNFLPFKNSGYSTLLLDLNLFDNDGNYIKVSGKVYGEVIIEKKYEITGHPRLLVIEKELNQIKEKIEKKNWRDCYEKFTNSNDIVVIGFMYFLTKDRKYVEKSKKVVEDMMKDFTPGPFNLGHYHGEKLRKISIGYDFFYEVWDDEFKNRVETYIRNLSERILLRPSSLSGKVNTHPASNYSAKLNPGAFIGASVILDEKFEKFPEIPKPQIIDIEPLKINYEGLDFSNFESLKMPERWLFKGPFENFSPPYDKKFFKEPIDISDFSQLKNFSALDEKYIRKKENLVQSIDILGPVNRKHLSSSYYLTGIENDKERFVKVNLKGAGDIYLNSQKVTPNDIIKLSKGKYLIVLKILNGLVYPWGESSFSFNLEEVKDENIKEFIDEKMKIYKLATEYYEILKDLYIERGNKDPFAYILFEIGRKRIEQYATLGLGEFGFNTEGDGYTFYSIDEPMIATTIYKKITGNNINKHNTLGKIAVSSFALSLFNGKFEKISYGGGSSIPNERHLARIFPVVPDEYKSSILWFWNKLIHQKEKIPSITDPDIPSIPETTGGEDLLYHFLFYPEDLKPVHPENIFPKVIFDSLKGGFIFRNRYSDNNDIIASIFGKSLPIRPCWQMNNAGDFRIWGLGEKWFIQGASDKNLTSSIYQNVVQIQSRRQNGLGGKIIFSKEESNSGVISFDLTDAYLLPSDEKTEPRDRYGNKIDEKLKKEDIKIIRSFGVDFSNLSGADALFVIIDYLKVDGEKLWQAVVGKDINVKINENEVILYSEKSKSSMKCWFFPKENIEIFYGDEIEFEGKKYSPFGKKGLKILWAKTKGEIIFCIITLQKENPPEIKVIGKEIQTQFIINKRKISFDKDRIVFTKI